MQRYLTCFLVSLLCMTRAGHTTVCGFKHASPDMTSYYLVSDVLVFRVFTSGFREHMHVFPIPQVQYNDEVAVHQAHWDTASLSCSLIAVCCSLPGLSVVSMSRGCMTALKLCTAATIMEHSTFSCIYDSIKKLHKDKVVVCYGVPFILLYISLSH